ncbi:MAG: gephyrin-like molybdotransferase Glp [Pseudomonadota bacterium]
MLDQTPLSGCGCDCDDTANAPALIDLETARNLSLSFVPPLNRHETVSLTEATARVLAQDIFADQAMPAFDNSAMDGFAVRVADLKARNSLPISGCVAAGQMPSDLPEGTAMRIFTGAPLPAGADAVVKIEDTSEADGRVAYSGRAARTGQNIRRAGSDQAKGARLVGKSQRLAAHHIGLLAGHGVDRVTVSQRPRVGILSTGNELTKGAATGACIRDVNRPMLLALASAAGAQVIDLGIIPDTIDATVDALQEASARCDLILTSGAVSMGGKDHMRDAVLRVGGQIDGWRVAIKPGKPVMFGRLGKAIITGLPGNPFAAFVGFHLFAGPQIARLAGARVQPVLSTPAEAAFDWARKPGRAEVFPARLRGYSPAGLPRIERLGNSVSATLFPLSDADGIALVSADVARIAPGDALRWHAFCGRGGAA